MENPQQESGWQGKLLSILRVFGEGGLVLFLKNLIDAWELWTQLRDRTAYHGMYEILDYHSTLDLSDPTGRKSNAQPTSSDPISTG